MNQGAGTRSNSELKEPCMFFDYIARGNQDIFDHWDNLANVAWRCPKNIVCVSWVAKKIRSQHKHEVLCVTRVLDIKSVV